MNLCYKSVYEHDSTVHFLYSDHLSKKAHSHLSGGGCFDFVVCLYKRANTAFYGRCHNNTGAYNNAYRYALSV